MFAGICDFSEFAAEFTVIDTPGHTPGGVCYYFEKDKLLFSGDTLFRFSVGRTDLPGGDMETLLSSLCRLTQLPDDTVVVPGHGSQTDISSEKSFNPFLQCGSKGSRK
jgi:glyoxylase-like metal-dependent hydrolase (beta-lactamase superfamily II)